MPGSVVHVGATAICPHGGQVSVTPGSPRVQVSGMPVATLADAYPVAGCAFTVPPGKPQPCAQVRWLVPAARVMAGGQPVIIQASVGLCLSADQIPGGPPSVVSAQPRVVAT
jgi:hypothetical protein